jgi:hypothetical protein
MNRDRFAFLKRLRRFLHPNPSALRTLIWIVAALVLLTAAAASGLTPTGITPTPYPTGSAAALKTALPAATHAPIFVDPNNVTNGIIIGGVILVLIIIGGTLQVLRPRSND